MTGELVFTTEDTESTEEFQSGPGNYFVPFFASFRNSACTRVSSDNSGWKVAAITLPCRTSTGSSSRFARTSTPSPTRSIRGARMKTISRGSPPRVDGGFDDGGIDLTSIAVAANRDIESV